MQNILMVLLDWDILFGLCEIDNMFSNALNIQLDII